MSDYNMLPEIPPWLFIVLFMLTLIGFMVVLYAVLHLVVCHLQII